MTAADPLERKLPDFSKPTPPKHRTGLDVPQSRLLAFLRRRAGEALITTEILKAMKESVTIWDNHAAVILTASRLVELGKIEAVDVVIQGRYLTAWMVKPPPPPLEPDTPPS